MKNGENIKWTDEMIATLAGMKRAGIKAQVIANRLGVSVKAVQNKSQRIGAKSKLIGKRGAPKTTIIKGRLSSEAH